MSSADDARERAKKILAERRFQPSRGSAPLRRPLAWIGEQTSRVLRPIGRVLSALVLWLFATPIVGALVVVAVVAGLFVLARRWSARRVHVFGAATATSSTHMAIDPAELERQADEAEAKGDHETAIRLRFMAGLVRLKAQGALPETELTNGEVRSQLRSDEFEELADDFDEIVYGGRAATSADAQDARSRWPRLTGVKR
jgi:Domain of unknown function (DUF4129)